MIDGRSAVVDPVMLVPLFVVAVVLLVAAWFDMRQFRVPNFVTLPLVFCGMAYHGLTGGTEMFLSSLLGAAFGLAILFLPYLVGGMGAGDVKLMAGVGAWIGVAATFQVFVVAAIGAGLYSLVLLVRQRRLAQSLVGLQIFFYQMRALGKHLGPEERVETVVQAKDRRKRLVPFAAMVWLAALALLLWFGWQLTTTLVASGPGG